MERLWTKSFILLTIGLFFLFTAFYMLFPTLPLFIVEIGGNESHAGLAMGAFMLTAVLFRPFIGGLIDQYGRRVFLIAGVLLFALSMFSYQFVGGIVALILLRVLHGLSWGMSTTAFLTSLTDIIPVKRRGEGLGWSGMAMTLAMGVGPMIGISIAQNSSYQVMFLVGCALGILALLLTLVINIPFTAQKGTLRIVFFEKSLTSVMLTTFLFFISYGGITTFIPLYSASIGFNSGTFFLIYAATLIISRPLSGRLADKYGYAIVVIPAICTTILSLIVLGLFTNPLGIILSAVLYGIGFGSTQPALQAAAIRLVAPNRTGVANASFTTAADFGIGLGAIILGLLAPYTDYSTMFIISAMSVGAALCVFIFLVRKSLAIQTQSSMTSS
ncbi:MFS transporter [Alkalicoccobacillus porphyridii]|uniref:MFS transporter n=1 Tax=Alkalicoccobacillus porphyridii TaxID=2597270 RepID=A0A554A152_9BACI|nr:MFS transporter [Alkalicoccobacillus porphyridii]TSB47405.1 MFS transporter [Alkalicoccobacillus porphyridii]